MCFEDSASCLGLSISDDALGTVDNAWNGVLNTQYDWTTTTPTAAIAYQYAITDAVESFGYGFLPGWFSAPTVYDTTITTKCSWMNFQRIHDYYKVEVADITTVWSVSSATGDDDDNTSTALTYAGSAALAYSAAAALAMLSTL
jgi:hypothetical protein